MSIALMTEAWKADMPSGRKLVLLSLCDNANDQGECFPSVPMIAKRCSMSERSVFNQIAELEKQGAIVRQNRNGRSTVYQLDPCKFCTPANSAPLKQFHATPAKVAPPPLQPLHPTPETVAPITVIEPSIEPSKKQKTAPAVPCPSDVDPQVWADWLTTRKAKKAGELTVTAFDGVCREASKAGWPLEAALRECCARGWVGFKAIWVADKQATAQQSETVYQRSMRLRMQEAAPDSARKDPSHPAHAADFFNAIEVPVRTVERLT